MYGLASHEYRGSYPVHERAERAEQALHNIKAMINISTSLPGQDTMDRQQLDSIIEFIDGILKD